MRNKEKFINDAKKVLKKGTLTDDQLIEDAAHTMAHSNECVFCIPSDFTSTGKEEKFAFELKNREATDNPNETVEDYFYIGRGE